jgi:uncharacterized protein YbjT (DUF2867 family)
MTSTIMITGGTGTLGRHVVPMLDGTGARLRVLSRTPREPLAGVEYVTGDLLTDEGIAPAVDGATTVLHLAGGPKGDEVATRNLARAAARAGVAHLVLISVVAADRVPLAYFRAKADAERVVAESGVPWTTLRAAQFHDLVLSVVHGLARSPVMPIPSGVRAEPVDARDVAARLVDLTLGRPAGRVPDLAGPMVYELGELADQYLQVRGRRRLMLPVRPPGRAGKAYRAGDNLAPDGALRGTRTWEEFLAERLSPAETVRR